MATRFFNPTDTTRVANSPRLGVGPGFDSQGCVTFLSQILLSQLALNPLGHSWVSDSATNSNIQVHKIDKEDKVHISVCGCTMYKEDISVQCTIYKVDMSVQCTMYKVDMYVG